LDNTNNIAFVKKDHINVIVMPSITLTMIIRLLASYNGSN